MPVTERPSVRRTLAILGVLVAACVLIGCGERTGRTPRPPDDALLVAASNMKLTFPENTRVLGYKTSIGERSMVPTPDNTIHLKIAFSRTDLDAFLRSSPFAGKTLSTTKRAVGNRPDPPGWDPESAERFQSGAAELPGNTFLNILVDLDGGDCVTVYLSWGEM